jgi:hypothetical protein
LFSHSHRWVPANSPVVQVRRSRKGGWGSLWVVYMRLTERGLEVRVDSMFVLELILLLAELGFPVGDSCFCSFLTRQLTKVG